MAVAGGLGGTPLAHDKEEAGAVTGPKGGARLMSIWMQRMMMSILPSTRDTRVHLEIAAFGRVSDMYSFIILASGAEEDLCE
ncbi:hypothetical protein BaRGS_00014276 [Batillaria attramentaria]|uniref:Uncharacterized protein n=1 Tax=Batillaria attramentaria TaxID=370345 RepID=A0ABD0L493_9CAEN